MPAVVIADQELLKLVLVKEFVSFSDRIVSLRVFVICILHIGVYGTARRLEEMHCIVMCTGTQNIIFVANMSTVHENSFSYHFLLLRIASFHNSLVGIEDGGGLHFTMVLLPGQFN